MRFCSKHLEIVLIFGLIVFASIQYYVRPQSQSLDQVVATGELRVLIADEPDSLYIFNDGHYGFEYELLDQYAKMLGVSITLDVVPYAELFTLLEGGFGDIAVGGIVNSDYVQRVSQPTISWYQAKATVVYKRGTKAPRSMEELMQAKVLAPSRYYGIDAFQELSLIDDHRSEYSLLSRVDQGEERFVLSTDYRARNAKHYLPNLNRSFILPEKLDIVWVLPRNQDDKLLNSINAFLERALEAGIPNKLADRHLNPKKRLSTYDALALHRRIQTILPRYELKFRSAARKGNIDWTLLAALAYQESHWSNEARSPTGVRGIMQLTTQTARALGVEDRLNMDESIDAAAIYVKQLRNRLPKAIKEPERTWFAIGAYNVGYGHIMAAYRKAREQGLDRTKWQTISTLLPTLYGQHFPQGVQAQKYVERIQIFTDVLRFYDVHLRKSGEDEEPMELWKS